MTAQRADWLLVLGDRKALAWVLGEQRMAFTPNRAAAAKRLAVGDRLFLYTTRGCFHNPTRDRGRVVGTARVASTAEELEEPLSLAGRTFSTGCGLTICELAPLRTGVELAPLVRQLTVFPIATAWSGRMRQPLLALPAADARLVEGRLKPLLRPAAEVVSEYIAAARP
jgi:hypothetical protein